MTKEMQQANETDGGGKRYKMTYYQRQKISEARKLWWAQRKNGNGADTLIINGKKYIKFDYLLEKIKEI